jgi:hypothetical protein
LSRFTVRLAVASMLGLLVLAEAGPAAAQSTGLTATAGKVEAPKYYGLHFDLGVYDSSGLNFVGQNYYNAFSFYFEPSWSIGAQFASLRSGPLKNLTLAGRFIVTANVSGTDPAGFNGQANTTPIGGCSDLTARAPNGDPANQENGGVIDPTQVQRCNPAANSRRADYSDFWLTLRAPSIYKIPKLGININPSLRFIFPASEQSRYATLVTSITPMLGLGRSFWKGRLRAGFIFGVNKNIHLSQTPKTLTGQGPTSELGGNTYSGLNGGRISEFGTRSDTVNTNFSLLSIISGGVQFSEKWSLDAFYIVSNAYAYDQPCTETVAGMPVNLCANGDAVASSSGSRISRPGRRDFQTLWVSLGYQPWDYVGFSLSWINSAPMWNPDSSYRQGVFSFDYNGFTSVNLGLNVSIDSVATTIQAKRKKAATPVAQSNSVSLQ